MPSVGKDLLRIRKHLDFTIDDIHGMTKIPVDTLRAIESGDIFKDKTEVKTYIRSFVRTYARALKINDAVIVKALDQHEAGNYNHLLLNSYPELVSKVKPDLDKKTIEEENRDDKSEKESDQQIPSTLKNIAEEHKNDFKTDEPEKAFTTAPAPNVRAINWAEFGKRIQTPRYNKSVWLIAIALIAVVVLIAAFLIFGNGLPEDREAGTTDIARPELNTEEGPALDFSETPAEEETTATLSDTLYLSIYAATGNLDPIRVWSDLKPRIDPYWIDQGVAMQFEFRDSIRVRGQYSQMLLFLNGHLIENFRQEHFNPDENMVELTRSFFDSDPEWAEPVPFEIPEGMAQPDSVAARPSF